MLATLPTATTASFCPFSLSPGDHQVAILDLDMALLIDEPCLSIVRPKDCQLNMLLPQAKAHYLAILEEFVHLRQLLPQLFHLYKDVTHPSLMQLWLALDLNTLTSSASKVCTWLGSIARSYTWVPWLSPLA